MAPTEYIHGEHSSEADYVIDGVTYRVGFHGADWLIGRGYVRGLTNCYGTYYRKTDELGRVVDGTELPASIGKALHAATRDILEKRQSWLAAREEAILAAQAREEAVIIASHLVGATPDRCPVRSKVHTGYGWNAWIGYLTWIEGSVHLEITFPEKYAGIYQGSGDQLPHSPAEIPGWISYIQPVDAASISPAMKARLADLFESGQFAPGEGMCDLLGLSKFPFEA